MRWRSLVAALAALAAGCGATARRFPAREQAVAHLSRNLAAYERLAGDWRAQGQREVCREPGGGFEWNGMAVSRRVFGWKLERVNEARNEGIDLKSLQDVAGVLGTTTARIDRFLGEMDTLAVTCLSNVGVTLGAREGSYVQVQLAPFSESYGFRYAPPGDAAALDGLKAWAGQPADARGRRVTPARGNWFYFEGLARTAALPLSKIAGTLRDSAGAPLNRTRLLLASAAEDGSLDWASEAVTDAGGRFSLTQIPAGRYFLGLNLFSWTETDAPFPRTYYPGVRLRQQAQPVDVGESRQVDLGEFRVPYRVGNRHVEAEVQWMTGEPEPGASAGLCWDDADGRRCAAMKPVRGKAGFYSYDGADGVPYHLTARFQPPVSLFARPAIADPVRVPLISLGGPIRLVLK